MNVSAYVAGVYSSANPVDVERNVLRAMEVGDWLEDAGLKAYIPHLSHYRHRLRPRTYEEWMEIDFYWLRQCDCLVRIPGVSPGADREVALAERVGMPVFFSIRDAIEWAESRSTVPNL